MDGWMNEWFFARYLDECLGFRESWSIEVFAIEYGCSNVVKNEWFFAKYSNEGIGFNESWNISVLPLNIDAQM